MKWRTKTNEKPQTYWNRHFQLIFHLLSLRLTKDHLFKTFWIPEKRLLSLILWFHITNIKFPMKNVIICLATKQHFDFTRWKHLNFNRQTLLILLISLQMWMKVETKHFICIYSSMSRPEKRTEISQKKYTRGNCQKKIVD